MLDDWASSSSIMPQKKNPDAAELLRAKAPRIVSHLAGLHGVMHALPLTYNKDMQEDKEHLFDTVDTLELSLAAARGMLESMTFKRERLAAAATDEMLAAVDVADMLVKRGVPFRQSHGIVAGPGPHRGRIGPRPVAAHPRRAPRALRGPGRGLLRGAIPRVVAGVQGERGRNLADARPRAARPRESGAGLDVKRRHVLDIGRYTRFTERVLSSAEDWVKRRTAVVQRSP